MIEHFIDGDIYYFVACLLIPPMIQFSQKKKPQAQLQQPNNHRISSTPSPIPSQYKSQYLTVLQSYLPSPADIKLLEMDLLKKGRIQIDRNHFEPKMVVQMSEFSSNYQAILFKVSSGYFRTIISVLIVEGTSHSHNLPVIYNRSLNKIFTYEFKTKNQSCIKCVQVKEKLHQRLNYVLSEVYLQKIAAVLKIGPAITPLFGFDIVIYSNCIEFAMQKCRKIQAINHEDTHILKKKLATMHSFGLIHNDIKPSNIMVSQQSREISFIDFGLSTHIKEQIGFKTITRFSGTLEYCGSQMMRAYKNKQAEAVDLYYNDLFCLINSIRQLPFVQNGVSVAAKNEEENGQNTMLSWKNFLYYQNYHQKAGLYFAFMQIKYMLFTKQIINENIFSQQEMREQYFLKICDFLEMLPKSNYSRAIQNLFIAVQEKYGLQYFMRAAELRLPRMLKQEPQIDFTQQSDQDQIYIKTIRTIYAQQHESFEYIKKGDYGKNWLQKYKEVKQTNKLNLIRGFCNYIDFRKTLSSFDEKVQAAKQLMLTINPSLLPSFGDGDEQKCLVVCLKYLLMHFTQSKQPQYEQIIPMTIRNLIMLNQIEYSEITQIIKQLLGDSIDTLKKFMLKIRLQLLFQWAEKYWYSPKNNLSQNISQIFHIQIHQPFFTIIKKMHQMIFTFVIHTYTQIYKEVSKLFAAIYVGQEFIDELIIWQICYLSTDTSFSSQSRYQSLYINKASLIGNHNRKHNYTFDFYYVNLYGFRNRHTTSQFITQFYNRLLRCLQKQQLMLHFYNYYQYHQNNLMRNEVSLQMKQSYFLQVIRTLPPLLVLVQPQSTYDLNDDFFKQPFSILLLIQIYEFSKSMQTNQIPALSAQLRRYFTPTVLRELCPCIKIELLMEIGTKNRYCFIIISMMVYFYSILYDQQPFYSQQLSFYCSYLQTKLSQLKAKHDWQLIKIIQIQKVIVDSRRKIYSITKQYTSIIREYQLYLKKYLALNGELFLISRCFNMPFLTLIYEITIHLPSQLMETYQWYCDTFMKYNNFTALFQTQKGLLSLCYINSYLLTTQQYSAFLYFHSSLAVYMSQFVYIDQLKIYILSLQDLRLFKNIPTKQLWVLLNNNFNSYVNNQDTYFILLTSLLLSMSSQLSNLEVQSPGIANKWRQWLDFISSKVEKAVYDAKLFVLQNVYSYLLESAPAKVQITRNYVKYSKVVMKECVFMRNMRPKLSRYHSESRRYVQGISVSLKKWHFYATAHSRSK